MHRVGQFVTHVRARVAPEEEALARRVLPEAAWPIFDAMPVADRRHGLDVAERLLGSGHDDAAVLGAALLHDAAKGHRMRLWHRVAGVLLEAIAPGVLRWLASPDPASWRHGLYLYLHHAGMSAEMADAAGCSPRVGDFIRGSVSMEDVVLLRALERADDGS